MLFPTHLIAAAMLGRVSRLSIPALVVGAAIPDVVDKSVAMVGFVDLYHTVAHSVLLFALVVPIGLFHSRGRAVVVGWASHLCLDGLHVVVNGRPSDLLFLGWPVAIPPDPLALPPGAFVRYYIGSPSFILELLLWLTAGLLVLSDRRPEPAT